jgi:hypothetical protein
MGRRIGGVLTPGERLGEDVAGESLLLRDDVVRPILRDLESPPAAR